MSILSSILSPITGGFIKDVGDTVKQFVTTDADKLKLEQELVALQNNFTLQMEQLDLEKMKVENDNVTQRWLSDNTAGGLPALTRPLLVWWTVISFTIISVFDGNVGGIHINPAYIPIYQMLLVTVVGGYMGLRTFEKYKGVHNDSLSAR